LIDIPNGIIFAFLVLYLSVYINNKNKKKLSFNDVKTIIPLNNTNSNSNSNSNTNSNSNSNSNTNINSNTNNNININSSGLIPLNYSNQISSESEFIYKNDKPFPNANLKPFESSSNEPKIKLENTKFSINSNLINENTFLNRDGYDVTGCRYDFKNNPQNLTKFGPPLSQCSAYDADKVKACGTVFYPLNA
jgi:hypothetical protein